MRNLRGTGQPSTSRRDFLVGAAAFGALGAASLLGGCVPFSSQRPGSSGAGSDVPVSKAGGSLTVASYWPMSLDPCYISNYVDFQIAMSLFDPLVRYDYKTQELVSAAAEDWKGSADGSVFTFTLVKDATFHNGDPVTARDFKYAWERLLEPDSEGLHASNAFPLLVLEGAKEFADGEADGVSGIRVVNDLKLELRLVSPFYDFPVTLSYPALAPVPSTGAARNPSEYGLHPIGNGAFMMPEKFDGREAALRLVRFEEYYGQPAQVNALEFRFYEADAEEPAEQMLQTADKLKKVDESAAKSALEKAYGDFELGEIDYTEIPVEKLAEAQMLYGESRDGYSASAGEQTLSGQEASTQFLAVNFLQEPLTDANVRKAISLAINREVLSETLTRGTSLTATGIVPPDVEGFRDGAWPDSTYNVYRAKQALEDAGYPQGKGLPPLSLVYGGSFEETLFRLIQADLRVVGIPSKLVPWYEPGRKASPREVIEGSPSLTFSGWIIDYPLMESFITPFFTEDGVYNPFGYSTEEVEEGLRAARAVRDAEKRVKAYQEVEDLISADMPFIPLLFTKLCAVCSDRTNDLYVRPDKIVDLNTAWVSW
jgi:peptide/nickel transport system substrate-binding protein/oligopeptide transport system substrate-binding protein